MGDGEVADLVFRQPRRLRRRLGETRKGAKAKSTISPSERARAAHAAGGAREQAAPAASDEPPSLRGRRHGGSSWSRPRAVAAWPPSTPRAGGRASSSEPSSPSPNARASRVARARTRAPRKARAPAGGAVVPSPSRGAARLRVPPRRRPTVRRRAGGGGSTGRQRRGGERRAAMRVAAAPVTAPAVPVAADDAARAPVHDRQRGARGPGSESSAAARRARARLAAAHPRAAEARRAAQRPEEGRFVMASDVPQVDGPVRAAAAVAAHWRRDRSRAMSTLESVGAGKMLHDVRKPRHGCNVIGREGAHAVPERRPAGPRAAQAEYASSTQHGGVRRPTRGSTMDEKIKARASFARRRGRERQ